jgi:ATP-binding cassette, subfamily B, bacterial PglK
MNLRKNIVLRSLAMLNTKERKRVIVAAILQTLLSFLDLVGLGLLGVVGALAVTGVESGHQGKTVSFVTKIFGITNFSIQNQVFFLALIASFVLIARTLFSVIISRSNLMYLAQISNRISNKLAIKIFDSNPMFLRGFSHQEILFAANDGVERLVIGILGAFVMVVSDFTILILMIVALLVYNLSLGSIVLIYFGSIAALLYKITSSAGVRIGKKNSYSRVESNRKFLELLDSFKELLVRGRIKYSLSIIEDLRIDLGKSTAEQYFLPNVSKYVLETSVIFGALLISGFEFFTQDAKHAVGSLTIVLVAGARVAPALLRVQQSVLVIKFNSGASGLTFRLIEELKHFAPNLSIESTQDSGIHKGEFIPFVSLQNVTFSYPDKIEPVISKLSVDFRPGTVNAIVGPSGAGKSTLVDLILGVLSPDDGSISVSNLSPMSALKAWPGSISYVPQNIQIVNGTIRENVTLGFSANDFSDHDVLNCLRIANLFEVVEKMENGIYAELGENGSKLSGGQRQRLGIARSFITNPKLIILDEATSALDGESENYISEALANLKSSECVILIAHRLSTVRNCDQVIYLDNGKILGIGTFDELRIKVPDFDVQAKLLGM